MIEYPCPECGYDGPHPCATEDDSTVVECGSCYAEFTVEGRP